EAEAAAAGGAGGGAAAFGAGAVAGRGSAGAGLGGVVGVRERGVAHLKGAVVAVVARDRRLGGGAAELGRADLGAVAEVAVLAVGVGGARHGYEAACRRAAALSGRAVAELVEREMRAGA